MFERFKEFKALVENLYEKRIKILRLDNGGKFTLGEFNEYCKEVGIKRELTIPYNRQQNGVAERNNRSMMEVAKSMIQPQFLYFLFIDVFYQDLKFLKPFKTSSLFFKTYIQVLWE